MIKKILVSPTEKIYDPLTKEYLGARLVQIEDEPFDVASPLFWIDCDANNLPGLSGYYYDMSNSSIKIVENVPPGTNDINFDDLF